MEHEINCDVDGVADIVRGLATLSEMAATYASFTVSTGQSRGYPRQALDDAAESVRTMAQAEQELIDKIISNIVLDVADIKRVDERGAQVMLGIGR